MPWDAQQFSSKHNHKLAGTPAAGKAARVATALLGKGYSDASAIRIGNSVGNKALSHANGGKVMYMPPGAQDMGINPTESWMQEMGINDSTDDGKLKPNPPQGASSYAGGGKIKSFPIPSKPAPSGGEDNPPKATTVGDAPDTNAYESGGMIRQAKYAGGGAVCNGSMRYAKGG